MLVEALVYRRYAFFCFVYIVELVFVPMPAPDLVTQNLAKVYGAKTDEELLQLLMDSEQLTGGARAVLDGELAKRRIDSTRHLNLREETEQRRIEQPRTCAPLVLGHSQSLGEFLAEAHSVYRDGFWLYSTLTALSVVVAWIAKLMDRYEMRQIARHIPPPGMPGFNTGVLETQLVNFAGYIVCWTAFVFSYGAVCVAVSQNTAGMIPTVPDAFAGVRRRTGRFLTVSLLLFLLLACALTAVFKLVDGVLWALRELHRSWSFSGLEVLFFFLAGFAILVFSRLILAIPAVILGDCKGVEAIFRSDELTEGKWLTLAAILAESLIGGYVAGMWPFWLASRIPATIALPGWFQGSLTVASIAGVTMVETTLFVGLAVLYLRMSALSTSSEGLARQLA